MLKCIFKLLRDWTEFHKLLGMTLGNSKPLSLRLINLQAIVNSIMFMRPSASVSAKALKMEYKKIQIIQKMVNNY